VTADLEPALARTMSQLIRSAADRYGDDVFLVEEDGTQLSFRAFAGEVEAAARALVAAGVGPGERIAIWAPNSGRWVIAACAAEAIGAVMTPINTRFRGHEAGYVLRKSGAKILFTVSDFLGSDYLEMLRAAMGGAGDGRPVAELAALGSVVMLDDRAGPGATAWSGFLQALAPRQAVLEREAAVRPEDTCDILFTSGTTGAPKGAMHAHGQALWMVSVWNAANDLRRGDRALIINPFFHSFGYRSGWVSALMSGMRAYPVAVFDAAETLRRIASERISVLMGSPTLFNAILDHPDRQRFDLSSLRVGHTGSSNVPVDLIRRGRDELGFELFLTSFGLTEATALVSVNTPEDDFETIARTVGRPLPGTEVKIVSPEGEALALGEAGELLVRGPNVMQGYFEDPEATAKAVDAEGWLHTGDVAALGPDGRLRILDRLKDVVIVGGFNAYPAEIEHTLLQHPAIAEAAIIAVPDARMGEVCAACVVLKPGAELSLAELTAWSRERLANFKVPRHLFVEATLPKTPLGKVQKFQLRKAALEKLGVAAA
jgi:acyl-CoA synthetase (AMP-forming)/AMP-acid ligase II